MPLGPIVRRLMQLNSRPATRRAECETADPPGRFRGGRKAGGSDFISDSRLHIEIAESMSEKRAGPMIIYPEYRASLRPVLWILGGLAALLAASWVAPPIEMAKGIAGYASLHLLLETAAIVVAMLVFGICWGAYDKDRPGNLVLLACVFLGVAILDFLHAASYAGMPDFVSPSNPEKAINFWLMARALSLTGLLAVALLPWRPMRVPGHRWLWLAAVLVLVMTAGWIGLLHMDWLPRTYVPGQGLTQSKIACRVSPKKGKR